MSKHAYFTRYLLILKKLQRGAASFAEVLLHLEIASEVRGTPFSINLRTFQRDLKEIETLFGVTIRYCRTRRAYYIAETDAASGPARRLLESYELIDALHAAEASSAHVVFEERKPTGLEHFHPLLHAIRERLEVGLRYQKFDGAATARSLRPLALKESQGRWYLIAEDAGDGLIKTFGLDRMSALQIGTRGFKAPPAGALHARFADYFGVLVPPGSVAEDVVLRFAAHQGQYVKTFPLHRSQQVVEETATHVVVQLHLAVTYDFQMEILSYGAQVQVVAPGSLVAAVAGIHRAALQQYAPDHTPGADGPKADWASMLPPLRKRRAPRLRG